MLAKTGLTLIFMLSINEESYYSVITALLQRILPCFVAQLLRYYFIAQRS